MGSNPSCVRYLELGQDRRKRSGNLPCLEERRLVRVVHAIFDLLKETVPAV